MAQTNRPVHVVDEHVDVHAGNGMLALPAEDVLKAATALGFDVVDGEIILGSPTRGILFKSPLRFSVQFAVQSILKNIRDRTVTASGDLNTEAAKIAGDPNFTPDRDASAIEALFRHNMRVRVAERFPRKDNETEDEFNRRVNRDGNEAAEMKSNRDRLLANDVRAALLAGENVSSKAKATRGRASKVNEDLVFDAV